ncbi:hypothetical protein D9613_012728 [Agrocybe pediades]|uniref:Zinc finger PHD-type domain-containing protein n=1 Tax=Agrocybe pediades TaxID=84607 RepID=A0A8H4QLK8_9AGAR|nr:hypothetical protein D9613_012728 [Agrocybe pediades]
MESVQENQIALDNDRKGICPDCGEKIGAGTAGAANIEKRHRGSKACREAQQRKERERKKKNAPTLANFFARKPVNTAVSYVPSTISIPTVIRSQKLGVEVPAAGKATGTSTVPHAAAKTTQTVPGHASSQTFLEKLEEKIRGLPQSVPEGEATDSLAMFAGNPANSDIQGADAEELWELVLNQTMKTVLGWGTNTNMNDLVRRGRYGLDGLLGFVKYFVIKRGVDEGLFEGKLSGLYTAIDKLSATRETSEGGIVDHITSKEPAHETRTIIEIDSDCSDNETRTCLAVNTIRRRHTVACKGFSLAFASDKTPHTTYPFALHDTLLLPWDYAVRNGQMVLFSNSCRRVCAEGNEVCLECQHIGKNEVLEGILLRSENGVHENSSFAYHGMTGLHKLLRKKNQQIEYYRLRGLNQAKKLLGKATALSEHKRLLMAVSSGKVQRVDRVISVGLSQNMGVRGLLAKLFAAAEGIYKPNSFSEEEAMKALLTYRWAGRRVADIQHRAAGAPSITYLRSRSLVPRITPSPGKPTVEHVNANVEATLQSISAEMAKEGKGKCLHAVLSFDEIKTEKRIRWDPRTNLFLGVCREHAHNTALEFVNEADMEELFRSIDNGSVHYATEATIGALSILCKNNRLYPARPILVSGDCKRETGEEHARVIQTTLDGVNSLKDETRLRIVSLASDGESRRGSAFILLTFKHPLLPSSPIYPLLNPLIFMNLYVGDDDITADKDWKHVFKRFRNLLLRQRGLVVDGFRITPDILREHFRSEGLSSDHIRSILNPDDQQDVKMAFDMLKDIWSLPEASKDRSPGYQSARRALRMLGKLLFHLVFPYLCVDLSLSEQLEHLSAAAHLAIALFKLAGKDFIPTNLYVDMMIMIKNVFFCVAKAKVDDPEGELFIVLLGTDLLEELFGILRTMVGNDANLDVLQLVLRLAGTIEVANILAKYPHWDKAPRRLKLPALTRDSKELPDSSDHIKPGSWRGDVHVKNVSLQTSWKRGRFLVETVYPHLANVLKDLEKDEDADMLAPFGTFLFNTPLESDDIDESVEDRIGPPSGDDSTQLPPSNDLLSDGEVRIEVEDAIGEVIDEDTAIAEQAPVKSRTVLINNKETAKSRALSRYSRYRKQASSTDRLRRVQEIGRHIKNPITDSDGAEASAMLLGKESDALVISDPIASLISCEDKVWLCIGEVNGLKLDGQSVPYLDLDMLNEDTVAVSYQVVGLRPATSSDDPDNIHDWRTYRMLTEHSFTVPGYLVQPINPTLSVTARGAGSSPFYLMQSTFLVAMSASLFQALQKAQLKAIPKLTTPTQEYPYRETSGSACFLCSDDEGFAHLGTTECGRCRPNVTLDLSQGQRVLEHMGAHILFDQTLLGSSMALCGQCLRPSSMCQFYLKKGKGAQASMTINHEISKACPVKIKYQYRVASESTRSSPCSNVPIQCPLCPKSNPAVWRYSMKIHFQEKHPQQAPFDKYSDMWELTNFEKTEMKKIWAQRSNAPVKRTKKARVALVISETHRARIPNDASEDLGSESSGGMTGSDNGLTSDDDDDEQETRSQNATPDQSPTVASRMGSTELEETSFKTPGEGVPEDDCIDSTRIVGTINEGLDSEVINESVSADDLETNDSAELPEEQQRAPPVPSETANPILDQPPPLSLPLSSDPSAHELITEDGSAEKGRPKRKRVPTQRVIDAINACLCGEVVHVSEPASTKIKCKSIGCETQWWHLKCVNLEIQPRNWKCKACEASSANAGSKRVRR